MGMGLLFEIARLCVRLALEREGRRVDGTCSLVLGIECLGIHAAPAAVVGLHLAPILFLERGAEELP